MNGASKRAIRDGILRQELLELAAELEAPIPKAATFASIAIQAGSLQARVEIAAKRIRSIVDLLDEDKDHTKTRGRR